jgi:effector-binding domain-containing protein
MERLGAAGVTPSGSPVAYYEDAEDDQILVHAAVPVDAEKVADLDVHELPELAQAATIVHQGDMMDAERSMQTLARWIEDNGYRSQGYAREVTLQFDPENPANWVHEFQISVTRPD